MVNKIIEKVLAKLILKKFGIHSGLTLKSIEINAAGDRTTRISVNCDITVKNEDLLAYIDRMMK